ncbi:hypothetical protein [Phenylobacterium ferrooxidans]|uniref:Beta-carotene 15,15'-monooxygenase n=1 Tax=Phenylobacterium ferrooxidans TaxID=2982689 RepID=A0ABW6CPF2_9CAUL
MSITVGETLAAESAAAPRRHLWGPTADFLLLGGGSLLAFPVLLLLPADRVAAPLAAAMWMAINILNHPHFAHSYQIFYRGFGAKALTGAHAPALRWRYVFAGIVVPLVLAAYLGAALMSADSRLLGFGGNLMAFFVGWHYVKQGYGMLMVDAALKRSFFTALQKKVFLVNAYVVWVFSWLNANHQVKTTHLWGLDYYALPVPAPLLMIAGLAAALTTAATLLVMGRAWRSLPWNGAVAYGVSLYIWLVFMRINPLWLLVIPAFHSLQYLAVVWRYQGNVERAKAGDWRRGFAVFVASGVALGFVGFWALPNLLDAVIPYDHAVFGTTACLFAVWIFINIHHFFLDNVMWRRENPDTRAHLFS